MAKVTMRMTHKGRPLTYQAIVARPLREPPPPKIAHPWRKRLRPTGETYTTAAIT
jgi:hypothetical protein